MKHKHNKKRNTAFLFEVLIREMTKSVIEEDASKKNLVVSLLKKYFAKGMPLYEELQLYKNILASKEMKPDIIVRIVSEAKRIYSTFDQKDIFNQQSQLIKQMNKDLSKNAFSVFVPTYKDLATVYQIFNTSASPKKKVLLEERLIKSFTQEEQSKELLHSDSLMLKTFIKKFNNQYTSLFKEQKDLINKYITSFVDDSIELKIYLNEEISRLKKEMTAVLEQEEKFSAAEREGLEGVRGVIDTLREQKLSSKLLERVLKIQTLIRDIKNETN